MPDNKINPIHVNFLEELLKTIIGEKVILSEIVKMSKDKGIKGLTNDKIRGILKTKGMEYDKLSKKFVICPEVKDIPAANPSELNTTIFDDESLKHSNQLEKPNEIKCNHTSLNPEPNRPNKALKSLNYSKLLSELSERITKQELLSEDILREIVELASIINAQAEQSLRQYTSDSSINMQQFVEFSYSRGKRYEVTLREDLVKKATEKIKNSHNLESVDLTKLSNLFELILFDYVYSSI